MHERWLRPIADNWDRRVLIRLGADTLGDSLSRRRLNSLSNPCGQTFCRLTKRPVTSQESRYRFRHTIASARFRHSRLQTYTTRRERLRAASDPLNASQRLVVGKILGP